LQDKYQTVIAVFENTIEKKNTSPVNHISNIVWGVIEKTVIEKVIGCLMNVQSHLSITEFEMIEL